MCRRANMQICRYANVNKKFLMIIDIGKSELLKFWSLETRNYTTSQFTTSKNYKP